MLEKLYIENQYINQEREGQSVAVEVIDTRIATILPQDQFIHTHRGKSDHDYREISDFFPRKGGTLLVPKKTRPLTHAFS